MAAAPAVAPPMAAGERHFERERQRDLRESLGFSHRSSPGADAVADSAQDSRRPEGILAEITEHGRRHHAHAGACAPPRVVMHWCSAWMNDRRRLWARALSGCSARSGRSSSLASSAAALAIGLDYGAPVSRLPTTPVVGQITHMNAADDRRQMMFAMRFEADVAQHDHVVVPLHSSNVRERYSSGSIA